MSSPQVPLSAMAGGVRLGPTSYRLVSAKGGGDTVGAASDADRSGVDGGGATSWTVLLGSGDLALAALGCVSALGLFGGAGGMAGFARHV